MKQKLNKLEKYWVMYDVGNSAFALLVSTIIPIYFKNMAAGNGISASDSTAYLSYAISISTLIVAVLGPVLGTVADGKNRKKPEKTVVCPFYDDRCAWMCGTCTPEKRHFISGCIRDY